MEFEEVEKGYQVENQHLQVRGKKQKEIDESDQTPGNVQQKEAGHLGTS